MDAFMSRPRCETYCTRAKVRDWKLLEPDHVRETRAPLIHIAPVQDHLMQTPVAKYFLFLSIFAGGFVHAQDGSTKNCASAQAQAAEAQKNGVSDDLREEWPGLEPDSLFVVLNYFEDSHSYDLVQVDENGERTSDPVQASPEALSKATVSGIELREILKNPLAIVNPSRTYAVGKKELRLLAPSEIVARCSKFKSSP